MTAFSDLAVSEPLLQAVAALDYAQATPIQAQALPLMLAGHDVRAQAKTGSGKTAAFSLALLSRLQPNHTAVQGLVLCPTRELADQVSKDIRALARFMPNIKVLSLCGGIPLRPQLASLSHEPHIAVGTPGRLKDLIGRGALRLDDVSCVVLDEADRMLDMGFLDDVQYILNRTPSERTTWLFSATYPAEIEDLSARFQNTPQTLKIDSTHQKTAITQHFYKAEKAQKPDVVMALLRHYQPESCLIFCNTRIDARELTATLCGKGAAARELHGELDQRDRDETLVQFANGSCRVLVATDIAARGLDIKDLPLVIGYELPSDPDIHVHRIGRTGRAGASGAALSLVSGRELNRVIKIEQASGQTATWSDPPAPKPDCKLPESRVQTLVIDAGRKDKLRPGDILGALTGEAGLRGDQIGKIDICATRAYVAVARQQRESAWRSLRDGKIKGRRFRVRKL